MLPALLFYLPPSLVPLCPRGPTSEVWDFEQHSDARLFNPSQLFFFYLTADPISPDTRLPLTGSPSISTRNSFLLLGLSFFYTSSHTGGTATRLLRWSFPCHCRIPIAGQFFEFWCPELGWLAESPTKDPYPSRARNYYCSLPALRLAATSCSQPQHTSNNRGPPTTSHTRQPTATRLLFASFELIFKKPRSLDLDRQRIARSLHTLDVYLLTAGVV